MTDPNALVVVGSYGMPGAVELQARLVRAHCGDVPVLVSDDHTAEAYTPAEGPGRGADRAGRLRDVCRREGLELVASGPRRLGHVGGDLAAFRHGIARAQDLGVPFVVKLSQRFLIDVPGWLAQTLADMRRFDAATGTHHAQYGRATWFHLRTECVAMRTDAWSAPGVLAALEPTGGAAEQVVYHRAVRRAVGATVLGPRFFGPDRLAAYPGVWWHDSHPGEAGAAAAAALAARFGVALGDGFHADGSHRSGNYRP